MKILFNTALRRNLVNIRIYHWLETEMAKHADCKYWGPKRKGYRNMPVEKVVKHLYGDDSPDWVIATPYMHSEEKRWLGYKCPKKRDWKIAVFTDDLHANNTLSAGAEGYADALNRAGFDAVLMWYTQLGYAKRPYHEIDPNYYLKNLRAKVWHCPKFIHAEILKPSRETKKYDAVLLGAVESFQYPLRNAIWNHLPKMAKKRGWRILLKGRPPGPSNIRDISTLKKQGHIVGDVYTEALARSKIFIFGSSIYKYPLLKYFEAWGCGTCILADKPYGANRIHMVPQQNFVEINLNNWQEKLTYYLKHDGERETIAKNGYETVMKHHTVEVRAKELLRFLEENQ